MIETQSRSRERRFPNSTPMEFARNLPSRDPSGRPALVSQEGVAIPKHFLNLERSAAEEG